MKKKTFIVQLLNSKKPSKNSFTQVEDALFYSNDTDAYLVFLPHEQERFEFNEATVALYNTDDESLVERPAVIETFEGRKSVVLKMTEDLLAHWGRWQAQVVFKQGDKINTSVVVKFGTLRYMLDQRPPTLRDVIKVDELYSQLVTVMDEIAGKDVISAPEIILARGGENTLGERLDKEHNEVATQLAQTATDIEDRGINVKKFGAKGDGVTDDSQAIQDANDYCLEKGLVLFSSDTHFLGETVTINADANLENATFLFDGSQQKSVKIVSYSDGNQRVLDKKISLPLIKNISFSNDGYPTGEQTAVYVKGFARSKLNLNIVEGFKTALNLVSDSTKNSIAWSDFVFSFFINNQRGLVIEQTGEGYINSNIFTSYASSQYSNTNRTINYQMIIDSEKTGATGIDSNTFVGCDFESRFEENNEDAVIIKNATNNVFVGCRWEITNDKKIVLNGGNSNLFLGGYGLNPYNFTEINNPNYNLLWQNRITTNGNVESKGLTTIGDRVSIKDGTVYPIFVDNKNSDEDAYVRLDVSKTKKTGQMEHIDGKNSYIRRTEEYGDGKYYTRIDAKDRLRMVANEFVEIESNGALVNSHHIQTMISCTTAERPNVKQKGMMVFDIDLNIPIFGVSTDVWVDAVGNQV